MYNQLIYLPGTLALINVPSRMRSASTASIKRQIFYDLNTVFLKIQNVTQEFFLSPVLPLFRLILKENQRHSYSHDRKHS